MSENTTNPEATDEVTTTDTEDAKPTLTVIDGDTEDETYQDKLARDLYGPRFDPCAHLQHFGGELGKATAITHRLAAYGCRYDGQRSAWLYWGTDDNEQPVWRIAGGKSDLAFARTKVTEVGDATVPGKKDGDETDKARAAFRASIRSRAGINALADLVVSVANRTDNPLHTRAEWIAREDNPKHFWAGGVLWDLEACADGDLVEVMKDGEPVRSHQQVHLATAMCGPDKHARTPKWDTLLHVMSCDDPEWEEYLLNVVAVCLTGYSDRVLPVFWGEQGRGKTVTMKLVLDLLGSYGYMAPKSFLDPNKDTHEAHIVQLEGKRGVGNDEAFKPGTVAAEHIKNLTGGAKQTAAAKFQAPITIVPMYTLMATSNEVPHLTDAALRNRLRPVEFKGDADEVKRAVQRLYAPGVFGAEAPGILAELMVRAGRYLRDRSLADVPAWVDAQLDELVEDQDPVALWVASATQATGETEANALYADFTTWCREHNVKAVPSMQRWGRALSDAGHERRRAHGKTYRPLMLNSAAMIAQAQGRRAGADMPATTT